MLSSPIPASHKSDSTNKNMKKKKKKKMRKNFYQ
jgi:hypothetical protein